MNNEKKKYDENVHLIIKYLAGEATTSEIDTLASWRNENPVNQKEYERMVKLWKSIEQTKNRKKVSVDKAWEKFGKEIDKQQTKKKSGSIRSLNYRLIWIAAVIFGVIFSGVLFNIFIERYTTETYTTKTSPADITLPDGSKVSINRYSTLTWPKQFPEGLRRVTLEGEAFFDVRPNKERPFVVDVNDVIVRVTGTSFHVSAYRKNKTIEVIVTSGAVKLNKSALSKDGVSLKAGQKGIYDQSDKTIKKRQNTDMNYLAWKTKILTFRNQPFIKVVETMNKVYDKKIIIENKNLEECLITVRFEQQSLKSVLEVLRNTLNISITKKDESYILTGDCI
jgi:transmembrane sensor